MSKYSYEQRMEAVLNVTENHMSLKQAADLLGTGKSHIRLWVKRYEEYGTEGLLLKNVNHSTFTAVIILIVHIVRRNLLP